MYGHVLSAFQQVSLKNRYTWHHATLREWLDWRSHLLEKQRSQKDPAYWIEKKNKAVMEVSRRLSQEMHIHSNKPKPPKGGDIEKRRQELMDELFYKKYPDYDPMTDWELEFLKVSEWLDKVVEEYHQGNGRQSTIGLLFDWLLTIEAEQNLAVNRAQKRARFRDSVAVISERRLKSKRNPYYPRPLELIHIYRAGLILIQNIQEDFSVFVPYGEPVSRTESEESFRIREYLRTSTYSGKIISFVQELQRLGYLPFRDENECVFWSGWSEVLRSTTTIACREFLSFLFNVSASTIKKDLSRKRLHLLYEEKGVAEDYRCYLNNGTTIGTTTFLRSGWFDRIVDGAPSLYDLGTT